MGQWLGIDKSLEVSLEHHDGSIAGVKMNRPFVVLKFGGTSVATAARWTTIESVAQARIAEGFIPILVCSAVSGVSNQLDHLLNAALKGEHDTALGTLLKTHETLAQQLGIECDWLHDAFEPLRRLAAGAALIGEVTPRMKANVMAMGELLSTRLGAQFLSSNGLNAQWIDARRCLKSRPTQGDAAWLSAHCLEDADEGLMTKFQGYEAVITQGFIAENEAGDTVLLGRGGSDTSAALFAARLQAERCEIWTDVPGVYTSNPREIPDARLLRLLDYDEAQEIASAGAGVLHPRCLGPVRRYGIPLHVRCTPRPELPGTVISGEAPQTAEVKVITARKGITLVSMSSLHMWQNVGFLADAFACFKRHGISVDLVSTSETNVTASFDPQSGVIAQQTVSALLDDLAQYCHATLIRPCAAVSLVGRHIRAILPQLGPALEVFESQKIHLVSQAASDLNLTFVVEESQSDRLVRKLHTLLFSDDHALGHLGPTWKETFDDGDDGLANSTAALPWWRQQRSALLAAVGDQTPAFVYDGPTIDAAVQRLQSITPVSRLFYAMKANDAPSVLQRLEKSGIGFECVSKGEIEHLRTHCPKLDARRILFTPNFARRAEYEYAFQLGTFVTVDALFPLVEWPDLFHEQEVLLRLDPGRGRGHHAFVRTAGAQSKFGISPEQLDDAQAAVKAAGCHVIGLHAHAGSGIRTPDAWQETAKFLIGAARKFPSARILDLGGGLGVVEKPGRPPLDVDAVRESLAQVRLSHPQYELWMEPGRYFVAEAGVLLTRVIQTKTKGEVKYLGVDAGMNTFIRPALYGAWHEITNLTRLDESADEVYHVVGPICETGDTLGYDRRLPNSQADDVLLLATAGAYGRTMSSNYNQRGDAHEILLDSKRRLSAEVR
ncbi:MAG: bifunctional aspartate kinase/diaminopimelate decarboxylase [Myxococcota bacterium]|nr:bifunctional aspartate kinase/diaminopimelate decarboxylase [Myxococcota bacterium]